MRAAIFNPYLDSLGGGERYTMTVAEVLSRRGYVVDVEWKGGSIREKLEERFGKDFSGINFVNDIKRGDGYDVCFWVSDGSIPTLRARKNLLHFQVPFHHVGGNNLLNKMKLFRINEIICNSEFTKKIIDREYGVESLVVYPPVPILQLKPKHKENIILSVGRFSQLKQSKHQDVLVKAFKKLFDGGLSGWKFVLAGGVEVGLGNYIERLKKLSEGYPVEIVKSPDFKMLKGLYGSAKIFWSASGFGEDEERNPEKVEHFGITVVEAMSAGVVPFAYKAGGFKETIDDGQTGFLWSSISELIKTTGKFIGDSRKVRAISKNAQENSKKFSEEEFEKQVVSLL